MTNAGPNLPRAPRAHRTLCLTVRAVRATEEKATTLCDDLQLLCAHLRANPDALSPFIKPEYLQSFRRIERYVIDDAIDIANIIDTRKAKQQRAKSLSAVSPLIKTCWLFLKTISIDFAPIALFQGCYKL